MTVKQMINKFNPTTQLRIVSMSSDIPQRMMYKGVVKTVPELLYAEELMNVNGSYVHFSVERDEFIVYV